MIDLDKINKAVSDGYVYAQEHPAAKLRIYNYSQKAQFEWHWPPEVMQCRGLILDFDGNVVARPFEKFFSYDQLSGKVPNEPFEVYDKLDGSLGILYWVDDKPFIATRGSFTSEQAIKGTEIFNKSKREYNFNKAYTYLFEIIYPENRIIVNYGETEDLVLLAVIETQTGKEIPILNDYPFSKAKKFDGLNDIDSILKIQDKNREGFVLRFKSGQRVKIKMDEYKRLHKLLTGINPRYIWETLRDGKSLDEIVERVPDEFFKWVESVSSKLIWEYTGIETAAKMDFKDLGDRKKTAEYFKTKPNQDVLFAMLDSKDYSERIWKKIKPKGERCFRCDIDL